MSKKADDKKNVVVVGGGLAGSQLARELSSKLDASKYNLVLINDRPYTINLIACARMTTSDVDRLEDRVLIPYDKLFVNGNGTFLQGSVAAIEETAPGQGGSVVLQSGERIPYAVLVLATGSKWSGPLQFPEADSDLRLHINEWRKRIADAKDIYLIGGGAVGIEFAGEIRDIYPEKKITIVHSDSMLLNSVYPDKFRKDIEYRCRTHGINIAFGEYVDQLPEPGKVGFTTRNGTQFPKADLVIPTFGAHANTAFVSSLGSDVLAANGCVKVKPTLELQGHPGVFAVGDIVDWEEQKQAAKAGNHVGIVAPNVLSFLTGQSQTKLYNGSTELIVIPLGKNGGSCYFDILWGIVLGDWFARLIKSKDLFVTKARSDRGL